MFLLCGQPESAIAAGPIFDQATAPPHIARMSGAQHQLRGTVPRDLQVDNLPFLRTKSNAASFGRPPLVVRRYI